METAAELQRQLAHARAEIDYLIYDRPDRLPTRFRPYHKPGALKHSPIAVRYKRGITSARARQLPWEIEMSEYAALITNLCHYCGGMTGNGVALDRIDNTKGYRVDNVVPCCGDCNTMRGDKLTKEEMEVAMKAVLELRAANLTIPD